MRTEGREWADGRGWVWNGYTVSTGNTVFSQFSIDSRPSITVPLDSLLDECSEVLLEEGRDGGDQINQTEKRQIHKF